MSVFIAQQVTRSHTIHLPATPHEVFPLFSPLGEKHWAQGWEPEMLFPSSGVAQVIVLQKIRRKQIEHSSPLTSS